MRGEWWAEDTMFWLCEFFDRGLLGCERYNDTQFRTWYMSRRPPFSDMPSLPLTHLIPVESFGDAHGNCLELGENSDPCYGTHDMLFRTSEET
jgi:hypothetical protein